MAALGDDAMNVTALCKKLNRSSDDSFVRYGLRMLTSAGRLERRAVQGVTGKTYLYRRKP